MEQDMAVIHSKSSHDTAKTTNPPINALFMRKVYDIKSGREESTKHWAKEKKGEEFR